MMKITPSNTSAIISLMIIYILVRMGMIFFPFPMIVAITYIPTIHYDISYFTFAIHIALESLFCVLYLYIISLLKYIGVKKFIQVSFYIHILVELIFFGEQILHYFWQQSFEYYSYITIISLASVLYTVISIF